MKKLLFAALIIFLSQFTFAQGKKYSQLDTIPKVNGNYEFQEIVQLDNSFKKDVLYANAKLYFVDVYKSVKDVIPYQYHDRALGKVIGRGFFEQVYEQNFLWSSVDHRWDIHYTVEITCKDAKYRYRI